MNIFGGSCDNSLKKEICIENTTLNWVKVDLTLFCLFLERSKIVNSYLAFTSVSVCEEQIISITVIIAQLILRV